MKTYQIIISGRVQGVSFRYFTLKNARQLGLKGWVKNLDDGSVEVVVQCQPEELAPFLKILERGPMLARVERVECREIATSEIYSQFTIEF